MGLETADDTGTFPLTIPVPIHAWQAGLVEMENLLGRANEAFLSHLDKNEGKTINIAELLGDYVCTVTTVLVSVSFMSIFYA